MSAKVPRVEITCPYCKDVFHTTESKLQQGRGKFCSKSCARKVKSVTHGFTNTPTYYTWAMMLQRCLNPRATKYPAYGGRGVTVCDRWRTFALFLEDMGERPLNTTLDRENGALGYFKGNCRWVTPREQSANLCTNTLVEYGGEIILLSALVAKLGVNKGTLRYRISRGWPESEWGVDAWRGNRSIRS